MFAQPLRMTEHIQRNIAQVTLRRKLHVEEKDIFLSVLYAIFNLHLSCKLGVARFIDATIYRDTFSMIRIAILFFTIVIFFFPQ